VVYAASTNHGCELLAVVSLAQAEQVLQLADSHTSLLQQLPLPCSA